MATILLFISAYSFRYGNNFIFYLNKFILSILILIWQQFYFLSCNFTLPTPTLPAISFYLYPHCQQFHLTYTYSAVVTILSFILIISFYLYLYCQQFQPIYIYSAMSWQQFHFPF